MSLFHRWGLSALMLCLPVVTLSGGVVRAADDAPSATETKAEDALVYKTLRDVINEGADMYNAQGRYKNMDRDYAGCYHLYEGALMVAKPLLGRHADLQKAIDDGMTAARDTPQMEKRAFVLREVIDKIREGVNPNARTVVTPAPPINEETKTAGKVVNGEKDKLIVLVDGKSRTFTVPDTAKVIINGKDGKLEDLYFERGTTVVIASKGDVVTRIVATVEAKVPVPPPPPVKETTHSGKISAAGADSLTIKTNEDKEVKYSVPATAKILLNGEETKLADLREGASVTITKKGDLVTKVEAKSAVSPPLSTKTLWDRLGGEANVAKVVDDFVNTAGKDAKVNFWRDPTRVPSKKEVADLKTRLVEFVSSATGGPLKYEGKSMKEVHKGMKITNEEFDAAAKDLKEALEKNHAKAEDVAAVMKAVDGTRKDIVEAKEPEDKSKPDEKKPEEKKTGEKGNVSGKVLYKAKPLTGGMVILTDADGKEAKADLAADGTFKLKDVKTGKYTVDVDAEGVPARFRSAKTSPLTIEMRKGEQVVDFALQD
jgi:truncated hemoglobin YjbI/antitoxin (DNA-binding transcriptional repressor) of toxin-antitoxin stability system